METMEQVLSIIEAQGRDMAAWQKKQEKIVSSLEEEFTDFAKKLNRPAGSNSSFNSSPQQQEQQEQQEVKSYLSHLRTGRDLEVKAIYASDNSAGGYLVPTQLEQQLTKYLRQRSPMRQLARVIDVSTGEYKMPAATGTAGYAWTSEQGARPETTAPKFKMVTVPTCEVYANAAISQNLLDDNVFDLENWLIQELSEAFGDAESAAFITGTGVGRPRGLFTYDVVATADATRAHDKFQYVPTGSSGGFGASPADAFVSLIHAVKPQYRQGASWLMSGEVLELVRKLKDGTGQYLWVAGLTAGAPSKLFGYPVYEDENVPGIAADALPVCFGDIARSYVITDRGTAILRDPYTNKPFVNFYSLKRLGGGAGRDTRAVKFLKLSAN